MFPIDMRRFPSPDGSCEALLQAAGRTAWESTRAKLCLARQQEAAGDPWRIMAEGTLGIRRSDGPGRSTNPARHDPQRSADSRMALLRLSFRDRVFDWQGVWSPCSRYFAIMEWRHKDRPYFLESQLVVFDLQDSREGVVDSVESGFIQPLLLSRDTIRYVKVDLAKNARQILEQPICGPVLWAGMSNG